ncbi:hypothetical protein LPJ73_004612, partial [Coemansia sp. RSA 2703]
MTFQSQTQHDEYMANKHVFAVHPEFESKFGNQLEFLKLGMQYITIGAEIFEAVNNLSMYKQIYDLEAEQTEEEIVEDVFEMEILETIQ